MKTALRSIAKYFPLLLFIPLLGHAHELPLWEAGGGAAVIDFPDYRGSDERHTFVLPVPYVVYRGEFLKIDRERVRGLFFKTDKAELDISLNGSVPVKSADNRARQGMPDLEPTLEVGPSLTRAIVGTFDRHGAIQTDIELGFIGFEK